MGCFHRTHNPLFSSGCVFLLLFIVFFQFVPVISFNLKVSAVYLLSLNNFYYLFLSALVFVAVHGLSLVAVSGAGL